MTKKEWMEKEERREEERREQIKQELEKIIERKNVLEKRFVDFLRWLVEQPYESRKTWHDWKIWWEETYCHFLPFQAEEWIAEEEKDKFSKFQKEVEE